MLFFLPSLQTCPICLFHWTTRCLFKERQHISLGLSYFQSLQRAWSMVETKLVLWLHGWPVKFISVSYGYLTFLVRMNYSVISNILTNPNWNNYFTHPHIHSLPKCSQRDTRIYRNHPYWCTARVYRHLALYTRPCLQQRRETKKRRGTFKTLGVLGSKV